MCTLEKRDNLFFLTLSGPDDHRLSPAVIADLLRHLASVKAQSTPGSVLITTASLESKFFSNGLDLPWAQKAATPKAAFQKLLQMVEDFRPVVAALMELPMPTVAAVTGHAAGGGFCLALAHDYIFMRKDKGVFYMSEVDLGMTIPDYLVKVFLGKIGSPTARRDILLRGVKVRAEEGVRMGIVDEACDSGEETLKAAMRMGEMLGKREWNGEVYVEIRKSLYPEICGVLGLKTKGIAKPKL